METSTIILIIIVAIALYAVYVFNKFVSLKNRTEEAWSDIDVQLKRRYDLIPNLIETVKGYAKHEKELFENVTKARANAMKPDQTLAEKSKNENMITDALKSIFAVSENYPDLRATENFQKLQEELTDTEDKIQASRRFFNGNVRDLNTMVDQFPYSVIAGMFKFSKREFFEAEEGEKEPVKVKF